MTSDEEKTAFEKVSDLIDELCDPDDMTKREYLDFLEQLETDISGRIEAAEEDLEDEEDGLEEP